MDAGGVQLATAQFTLAEGGSDLQRVRANFRFGGTTSYCSGGALGGAFDDTDDLVFAVSTATTTTTTTSTTATSTATTSKYIVMALCFPLTREDTYTLIMYPIYLATSISTTSTYLFRGTQSEHILF